MHLLCSEQGLGGVWKAAAELGQALGGAGGESGLYFSAGWSSDFCHPWGQR